VLLRDIRDRLSQRIPAYGDDDIRPTDPGWLMIEEAAWMVELLSEQLDRYPLSVVRQLLHLMGAEPLPATPAVGLVCVKVAHGGILSTPHELPPSTRMFTAQTETRDLIEFRTFEPDFLVGGWMGRPFFRRRVAHNRATRAISISSAWTTARAK
jgi:hypothetical protein